MNVSTPHYLLFSESSRGPEPGRWRFVLRSRDGLDRVVADDVEPDVRGERLELLAVVRGLEALDQPSNVTLVTESTYVREGIRYGLAEWRRNGWRWEWFGQMVPVKNRDLWRRVDRALKFHKLDCRVWRFDPAHGTTPAGHLASRTRELRQQDAEVSERPRPGLLRRFARVFAGGAESRTEALATA